ncbi:MAG: hypothetical protein ABIO69_03015 [Sphingomicrobium sp.]
MITALLLALAAPTAVDAERAFAADAKRHGQWTAFRKYADPTAVIFNPQAVWASEFLKGRKDPPAALSWSPSESYVSCDGRTAINKGPWTSASGKAHGYFTTVWMRKGNSWTWTYDGGDGLNKPLPARARPLVRHASCANGKTVRALAKRAVSAAQVAGKPPGDAGTGRSADGTLSYQWKVNPKGARHFQAQIWTGRQYQTVLEQQIEAPAE